MPVKIWELNGDELTSHVKTEWDTVWTSEEHRAEADQLDADLDVVLDRALERIARTSTQDVPEEFLRAWAVGASLNDSDVLESPALAREQRQLLWRALARKIRTGARADGSRHDAWRELRPQRVDEPRREGRKLDHFEMCRWLAQQDLGDSVDTFGGSIRNVWQMLERPALARAPAFKAAFLRWLRSLPPDERKRCFERTQFAEIMKVLRARWPERGPGAAKKPVHFTEEQLYSEIGGLLKPLVRTPA